MNRSFWLSALCAVALVAGCSSMKEPADKAVAAAETSLAAIKDDAAKYAPEALQPVESQMASLKESLTKKDYKAVMAAAPAVNTAISGLKDTVATKKAEMDAAVQEWGTLSTDLPKMVEAIQSRVDILSKSRKLPKNIDKAAFEAAKSGLESMKAGWAEASAALSAGNATDAVAKAKALKEQGMQIMQSLGMSS